MRTIARSLLVCLTAILITATAYSQTLPVSVGLKAGANLSNISFEDYDDTEAKVGYQFGLDLKLNFLTTDFFVLTGFAFTNKGCKLEEIRGHDDLKIDATYLQIPVMAGYKVSVVDGININFLFGPYFAHGIGGKVRDVNIYGRRDRYDTFGDDGVLKRFDMGFTGGVGIDISKLNFTLGYEFGITDNSQGRNSARNRNAFLTVGYYIF